MPEKPISYVLLTGATGFIGAHVLNVLLHRGLKVRVAVRDMQKAALLKEARPDHATKLDFIQVADYTVATSFQEAVLDVQGIIHVASPLSYDIKDNERDLVLPAINGTRSILEAASKSPQIQRVVITSSFASVIDIDRKGPPYFTYTADDWNPLTYAEAASHTASPVVAYRGSKKFAELTAWEFVEKEKPSFDLVTLCPPMVFGPFVHPLSNLDELNDSLSKLWEIVQGRSFPEARVPFWIDVRDLAQAHVECLLNPLVGNKRFTVAAPERFSYERAAKIIIDEFEEVRACVSQSITPQKIDQSYGLDGRTAANDLGISYRTFEEAVVDFVGQALRLEQSTGN